MLPFVQHTYAGGFWRGVDCPSLRAQITVTFLQCANNVPEQVELESNAVDTTARAGVRRVVKLSVLGAKAGSPVPF